MGSPSRSAVVLVALVFGLVGGLAGCLDDGVFYFSSGEPPFFSPASGSSPECGVEAAAPSPVGATGRRSSRASRAEPPARLLHGSPARAGEPAAPLTDGPVEPVGFTTAGCETTGS